MRIAWKLLFFAAAAVPLAAGEPVGMVTRQYTDPARPNWRTAGPRPEMTVIWYPAAAGSPTTTDWDKSPFAGKFVPTPLAPDAPLSPARKRYPLVLLSHGATSVPWSLMWLGTSLASHGYIAAAVAHHGDTGYEGQPLAQGFILMSERAKDISVVLDRLLADPMFGAHIDHDRIGAAGHSSGGETMIAVAGGIFDSANIQRYCGEHPNASFCTTSEQIRANVEKFEALKEKDPELARLYDRQNQSYREPRIRAIVAFAPAVGPAFTEASLEPVKIPVFIVVGSADVITSPEDNAERYARLIHGAKLTVIPSAGHMLFGGECTAEGKKDLPVLCQDRAEVDRHKVLQNLSAEVLAFFDKNLDVPASGAPQRTPTRTSPQ